MRNLLVQPGIALLEALCVALLPCTEGVGEAVAERDEVEPVACVHTAAHDGAGSLAAAGKAVVADRSGGVKQNNDIFRHRHKIGLGGKDNLEIRIAVIADKALEANIDRLAHLNGRFRVDQIADGLLLLGDDNLVNLAHDLFQRREVGLVVLLLVFLVDHLLRRIRLDDLLAYKVHFRRIDIRGIEIHCGRRLAGKRSTGNDFGYRHEYVERHPGYGVRILHSLDRLGRDGNNRRIGLRAKTLKNLRRFNGGRHRQRGGLNRRKQFGRRCGDNGLLNLRRLLLGREILDDLEFYRILWGLGSLCLHRPTTDGACYALGDMRHDLRLGPDHERDMNRRRNHQGGNQQICLDSALHLASSSGCALRISSALFAKGVPSNSVVKTVAYARALLILPLATDTSARCR